MPYKIVPIPSTAKSRSRKYRVVNAETGEVKAKRTTFKKAQSQVRLLEGLEHGTLIPRR